MQWPSISLILSQLFLGYIVYLIYLLSLLFVAPSCEQGKICLTSYLSRKPPLQLHMYTSVRKNPAERDINLVYTSQSFDYSMSQNIPLTLDIPQKTQQNGTMFLHVILIPDSRKYARSFSELQKIPYSAYAAIKMTQYAVPEAKAFNLLGEDSDKRMSKENFVRPVSHIKSKVAFTVMTDDVKLPIDNIPMELLRYIRPLHDRTFSPIVISDFLQTRYRDLVRIVPQTDAINVTVLYNPISIEKLRLTLHVETTMQNLKSLGFSDKDIDEVKGLFADTNIYLLGGTFFIAAVHLVFDFLAFKNDVNFWRRKDNLIGVSKWTVIWRTFSQTIIFLYLLDEGSSLLVLIPTGIGTIIEMWKLKKILKAKFVSRGGIIPRIEFSKNVNTAEMKTREFDSESMRYLSYLLYPLVMVGAVYSLLYKPHKSWYSWSINCLVNGVYAFGFLFMLPQLFVNYKLKSVAHLPWRAFMYKAFNTFIDDVFAFIITMPVAHRIACFRDDVVFLIYLYQRWLYPVDRSRTDTDVIEQSVDFGAASKKEK